MSGINKVIIIGNLGNDPEIKYAASGDAIANITVATSETWNDKNSGEKKEKTEWHRVVAYRRLAEIIGEYLAKGSKVYIDGKLQTRKWQDKDGNDRWTTEIVAGQMQMLDSKKQDKPDSGGFRKQEEQAPRQNEFDDDDIPF